MAVTVGIIMGSDSDLSIMKEVAVVLDELAVDYELTIVSAHRTPERMYSYAKEAASRGIQVVVAGAGGAAHLPGMVASLTHLPVIGVPIKSSNLSGEDSLLSIVQMPPGVPVATVAINGAKNAGILAAQIIAIKDKTVEQAVISMKSSMESTVLEKANSLEDIGFVKYLKKG
jgi:5-(carboxyamino)imidazole ribonucleotide mutase